MELEALEKEIAYSFNDKSLLKQALTHSSFSNEQRIRKWKNYERIEFLGDAVLELVSSDYFYHTFPEETEGNLTKMRAAAVCEQALAITARQLKLGSYMIFGKGEEANGGRERESIIADAVEAVIGAIYLDGGLEPARDYINRFILSDLEHKQLFYDSKTILQERVQRFPNASLVYILTGETGPEHDKIFMVEAQLNGKKIGEGSGRSKKMAEQQAAYQALLSMDEK